MNAVLSSRFGQAALAFLRVFVATVAACWVNAGMPIRTATLDNLYGWLELGAQAAAGLVIVNWIAPWEKRYGPLPQGKHVAE